MTDTADADLPGAVHRLPPDRTAPRRAREWVRHGLRTAGVSLDPDAEFDVLLCTSELVNAALLAGARQMSVRLTVDAGLVRVTLEADAQVPTERGPVALAQRQCLQIVERLAQRWGLDATPAGRVGWAEFRHVGDRLPAD